MERPWRVERVTLKNFRCFDEITLDFEPSLTVLVGRNGAGKSAVLDGLAVCLSTLVRGLGGATVSFRPEDARWRPHDLGSASAVARMEPTYPITGEVEALIYGTAMRWSRRRSGERGRTSWVAPAVNDALARIKSDAESATTFWPVLPVLALYGIERLVGVRRGDGQLGRSRFDAYDAALDGRSDLTRLESFLRALTEAVAFDQGAAAAASQLEAVELACDRVLDGTGWHGLRWDPLVRTLTLEHPTHGRLPLGFLSSGIKIAAGVVIDLASRAARANPALGADPLLQSVPGIVMIDEIDLHLHPGWQQRIIPGLMAAFPNVQFIVTTHSPQVLSTVPHSSIRVLSDGPEKVVRVDYSAGLRTDMVLREVLGTDPVPDVPERRAIDEYMALVHDNRGNSEAARDLRRRIEDEIGDKNVLPELADADAELAFQDFLAE